MSSQVACVREDPLTDAAFVQRGIVFEDLLLLFFRHMDRRNGKTIYVDFYHSDCDLKFRFRIPTPKRWAGASAPHGNHGGSSPVARVGHSGPDDPSCQTRACGRAARWAQREQRGSQPQ